MVIPTIIKSLAITLLVAAALVWNNRNPSFPTGVPAQEDPALALIIGFAASHLLMFPVAKPLVDQT
jgi:hypothetical protein